MDDAEEKEGLTPTFLDGLHRVSKAAISALPVLGGPATELFSALLAAPLDKRRDQWLVYCFNGLKRLQKEFEAFNIESLFQNEMFITTLIRASRVAIDDHRKEKREVLRNAVLNAAAPCAPEEDMQQVFIDMIDILTPSHLRLMKSVNRLWSWSGETKAAHWRNGPNPYFAPPLPFTKDCFQELEGKPAFFDHLLRDLANRGLLAVVVSQEDGGKKARVEVGPTPLGLEFRKFITCPFAE